jgi:anti-anti-sigma factor
MTFDVRLHVDSDSATVELLGELDASTATHFHDTIDAVVRTGVNVLLINAEQLTYMSSAGLRSLVFARQKMGEEARIAISGATDPVARSIRLAGFDHSIELLEA